MRIGEDQGHVKLDGISNGLISIAIFAFSTFCSHCAWASSPAVGAEFAVLWFVIPMTSGILINVRTFGFPFGCMICRLTGIPLISLSWIMPLVMVSLLSQLE